MHQQLVLLIGIETTVRRAHDGQDGQFVSA